MSQLEIFFCSDFCCESLFSFFVSFFSWFVNLIRSLLFDDTFYKLGSLHAS